MQLLQHRAVSASRANATPACVPMRSRRCVTVRATAAASGAELDRRELLLSAAAAGFAPFVAGVVKPRPASAGEIVGGDGEGGAYQRFLGYSQAPDLYLGYGASDGSAPRYEFEYPVTWEEQVVTKTDKSTMGMDGMVKHPSTRKEQAYVIALGGKDYRDSVLKDAKSSLIVIAGGDPDLRQAVTDGQVKQTSTTINGVPHYMYEIDSDKRKYLATISKKDDTVFALVVTAPHAAFDKDAAQLHHIHDTFKLL